MTPTKILVPIDFSSCSEQALDYAVSLAEKLGATVHMISAITIPVLGVPELGVGLTSTMLDKLAVDNQTALDKLAAARNDKKIIGQVLIRTGDARDVILQTAEELKADLIVMGTHGRRGISRVLLGSVTEMVVRTAPIPVLTVRGRQSRIAA